ncbi:MAG: DUF5060 domain-containing protein [Terracidiphilus sp.]
MNRRDLLKLSSYAVAAASSPMLAKPAPAHAASGSVARWDCLELAFPGPSTGNPFVEVSLTATFRRKNRALTVEGFYDGNGVYKVRFMPDELGEWSWTTASNVQQLHAKAGIFTCVAPESGNSGPVSVRDGYHFAYADGTPYVECGTTCYAWAFQPEATERQTIATLTASPFNKLRMCLFPKWYQHNRKEPPQYPFPRARESNNYSTFNAAYFQHFDQLILELRRIGVQADLILFHPYDKWGYQSMPAEVDDRYLRYAIARFSAYRNAWWSHGGVLHGASPAKIAFLRELLEETIAIGPGPIGFTNFNSDPMGARRANDSVIFYYFDEHQPAEGTFELPAGKTYTAEYIDTLALTRTPLAGEYSGKAQVKLPGRPWGSLWFRQKA